MANGPLRKISLNDPTVPGPSGPGPAQGAHAVDVYAPMLRTVARICEEYRLDALKPQIDACAAMLVDPGIVDVAVVGRFKAGKSSFLNYIIDRDVVPVAVLPVTAIVTRIAYGPRDRVVVVFEDGGRQETGLERLPDFVTEQRNPGNRQGVAIVEVEVQNLQSYRGVRFVDTPGLGSVHEHNTRTSLAWLPQVGAALLAVSVDHPLSEDDIGLLRELQQHTPETAILLTKADLVSPAELLEVQRFVREQLAARQADVFPILPFSIRPGFEQLRDAVRDYLTQHIASSHTETSQEILRHKLRSLMAGCGQYLQVARSAALAAAEARQRLAGQLAAERDSMSAVQKEIWLLGADLKIRLRDGFQDGFLAHAPQVTKQLSTALRAEMSQWRGNLKQVMRAFDAWATPALQHALEQLSSEMGRSGSKAQLKVAHDRVARTVRGFQDRLAQGIQQVLGFQFEGAQFAAEIQEPKRPDLRLGRLFDTSLEMVGWLLPMAVLGPLVRRHILHLLAWEVNKNLHRLAGQWAEAVGLSIDRLAGDARDFIESELATVERLVAGAEDRRPAVETALATLEKQRASLDASDRPEPPAES